MNAKQLDLFSTKRVTQASHEYMMRQIHKQLDLHNNAHTDFEHFINDNERAYDEYVKQSAWHIPKKYSQSS